MPYAHALTELSGLGMDLTVVVEMRARRVKVDDIPLRVFMSECSVHCVNPLHQPVILVEEKNGFRILTLANGDTMILRINTLLEVGMKA